MKFYIKTKDDKQQSTLEKINRLRKPKIIKTIQSKDNTIIVMTESFASEQIKKMIKKFQKMPNVKSVYPRLEYKANSAIKNNRKKRQFHFFFDIDSTLTKDTGTINRKIKSLFKKMSEKNHYLYLVSGRSYTKIMEDIKKLEHVQDHAIAENGGIILHGFAPGSEQRFGSKDEPTKVRDFLFENNDGVKLDMNQGIRITEIIILKSKTLTKQNIDYAIKQTKADAQVLASKTSFHISKKGINKGTAIDELAAFLELGDEITVAVGDSELDIPMFEVTDRGFAPSNASIEIKDMKKNRPTIMSKEYFEGVIEMYNNFF